MFRDCKVLFSIILLWITNSSRDIGEFLDSHDRKADEFKGGSKDFTLACGADRFVLTDTLLFGPSVDKAAQAHT